MGNFKIGSDPRKKAAQDWTSGHQTEIDALRTTGEYNPGIWDKVKSMVPKAFNEVRLDYHEYKDPVLGSSGIARDRANARDEGFDEDALREKYLNQEKQRALDDFKTSNPNKRKGTTSAWETLKSKGSYQDAD